MSQWSDDPIAGTETLGPLALYSAAFLIVPEYQRPLAWGNQEAQVFLKDLLTASEDQAHKYSLGVIYLANTKDTRKIIVDGQQRLTSLACLLIAVGNTCDALTITKPYGWDTVLEQGTGDFRIQFWSNVNSHLSPTLLKYKCREDRKKYIDSVATSLDAHELQIIHAIADITSTFEEDLVEKTKEKTQSEQETYFKTLITFLSKGVTMIRVLIRNEHEGTSFFENLNNRGVPLTDFDVIRNIVYREADPAEKASLAQELNRTVYTSEAAKWCENADEYAKVIKWCLQSRDLEVGGKNNKITDVVAAQIKSSGGSKKFVDEIKSDLKEFEDFWTYRTKRNDPLEFGLERLLDKHKYEILAPLIITLRRDTSSGPDAEKVIYAAFLFILRKTLIEGNSATDCWPQISKLIHQIRKIKNTPGSVVSDNEIFSFSVNSGGKIKTKIKNLNVKTVHKPSLVTILYLIEVTNLTNTGTNPKSYGANLNLEHIAPIRPKKPPKSPPKRAKTTAGFNNWLEYEGNKNQYERFEANKTSYLATVYRIGNVCLLDGSVNKSIKNGCVYAKINGHQNTNNNYKLQNLYLVKQVVKYATNQEQNLKTEQRLTWSGNLPKHHGLVAYENLLVAEIASVLNVCEQIPDIKIK